MTNPNDISGAVVRRLPRYYRYLADLRGAGVTRVSSMELSAKMNLTASQIRQDLTNFGCFGQQGYGYNVESLHNEIGKILGLERSYSMVAIGAGNLGQALARHEVFERRGFFFKAMFDIDPKLFGLRVNNVEIFDISELESYVQAHTIDIAVLTVPRREHAERLLRRVVDCGIKAIWNFTHIDLHIANPGDAIVENVHLTDSLMMLSYNLRKKEND